MLSSGQEFPAAFKTFLAKEYVGALGRPLTPVGPEPIIPPVATPTLTVSADYISDYDAILKTMDIYVTSLRNGDGKTMGRGFLPDATGSGYFQGTLVQGLMQQVFDLVSQKGPAPKMEARLAGVDIMGTLALVRLEVSGWSGKVAGPTPLKMSDLFTLVKTGSEWKIVFKGWHFHSS